MLPTWEIPRGHRRAPHPEGPDGTGTQHVAQPQRHFRKQVPVSPASRRRPVSRRRRCCSCCCCGRCRPAHSHPSCLLLPVWQQRTPRSTRPPLRRFGVDDEEACWKGEHMITMWHTLSTLSLPCASPGALALSFHPLPLPLPLPAPSPAPCPSLSLSPGARHPRPVPGTLSLTLSRRPVSSPGARCPLHPPLPVPGTLSLPLSLSLGAGRCEVVGGGDAVVRGVCRVRTWRRLPPMSLPAAVAARGVGGLESSRPRVS